MRRTDFKEDSSVRYFYHSSGLEHVESQAPKFVASIQSALFKDML